jgi:Ca-activated chloride channel family protein
MRRLSPLDLEAALRIGWAPPRLRQLAARLCIGLAVASLVLAAARPLASAEPVRQDAIVELVIDVSGSTNAEDLRSTRAAAMQRAALRLLDRIVPGARVGLVTFSGTATAQASPTTDRDLVRAELTRLVAEGPTALGEGLALALDQIEAVRPRGPAAVLLLSDGGNTRGTDPLEVARRARSLHVRVFAVAVGTETATISLPDEATGQLRQIPVPPDPIGLGQIADATGGRVRLGRSAAELDRALQDLAVQAGIVDDTRELSLLFVAAALLLLAVGGALSRRAPSSGMAPGRWARVPRWAASLSLLTLSAGAVLAWVQWIEPGLPPLPVVASVASAAHLPASTSAPRPPFMTIDGTKRDRALVTRAVALLRRHGELAEQRRAENKRQRLERVDRLDLTTCDVCVAGPLTTNGGFQTLNGNLIECVTLLNTGFIRQQARAWRVDLTRLVAMAVLHEQDVCMHGDHSRSSPADAERGLARKLHDPRLFDRFYAQIDAKAGDRDMLEAALALVRDHGELGYQRRDSIRRRHLNEVNLLRIAMCDGTCDGNLGVASADSEGGRAVACDVLVDLRLVEKDVRSWSLPTVEALAVLLVHEQEHCVRDPDDRESVAIDEERTLARKIGGARLLEYVVASYQDLDKTGHWKR